MIRRYNLASALLQGSGPYEDKLDPRAVAAKHGCSTPESAARFLLELLLQGDVDSGVCETLLKTARIEAGDSNEYLRRFAHAVVMLPEFNLA
jgi:hypothetical protein